MIRAFWAWLDGPQPDERPVIEHYPPLRCGTEGVAQSWINLTLLGAVIRARTEANRQSRRPMYGMEAPEWPRWCPWLATPEARWTATSDAAVVPITRKERPA